MITETLSEVADPYECYTET